jgi:hypothetical protein
MVWLILATAFATVPEKYGTGSASMALGGTGVSWVSDGHAAYLNPAGLSRIRRPMVGVGMSWAHESFEDLPSVWWDTNRDGSLDRRDDPLELSSNVEDAVGVHFHASRNIGGKFGLGIVGYIPTRRVLQLRTSEPDLPEYYLYNSRQQRYMLAAGIGGEVLTGVHVGVGVDFVPRVIIDAAFNLSATVVGDDGDDLNGVVTDVVVDIHELELEIVAGFAPTLGLNLDLGAWSESLEGATIGLAFHGASGLPVDSRLDAQIDVSVEDVGDLEPYALAAVAQAGIRLYDHYVPMTLALGLSYMPPRRFGAAVDITWTHWRPYAVSVAQLTDAVVTSPIVVIDDEIVDGNAFTATFTSTLSTRAGIQLPLPEITLGDNWRYARIDLRLGGGWVPTPLVSQGESSALIDSNRLYFTGGAAVETWDPTGLLDGVVRLDVMAQFHMLERGVLARSSDEPRSGYPVIRRDVPFGGNIFVVGGQWSFQY